MICHLSTVYSRGKCKSFELYSVFADAFKGCVNVECNKLFSILCSHLASDIKKKEHSKRNNLVNKISTSAKFAFLFEFKCSSTICIWTYQSHLVNITLFNTFYNVSSGSIMSTAFLQQNHSGGKRSQIGGQPSTRSMEIAEQFICDPKDIKASKW